MNSDSLVAKVWNSAHVLRDQGVSYQAYISHISYLLFLKMDEERVELIGEPSPLPAGSRWDDIKELAGEALAARYGLLETLSRQSGVIGAIFLKAQNEIQDPAKLKRLVGLSEICSDNRDARMKIASFKINNINCRLANLVGATRAGPLVTRLTRKAQASAVAASSRTKMRSRVFMSSPAALMGAGRVGLSRQALACLPSLSKV